MNDYNFQKGQALMMVVLVMFVGLTMVLIIFMNSMADMRLSTIEEQSERAFSVAESGIEDILAEDVGQIKVDKSISQNAPGFTTAVNSAALRSYNYPIKQNDTGEIQLSGSPTTKITLYWTQKNPSEYSDLHKCSNAGVIIEKWSTFSGSSTICTPGDSRCTSNSAETCNTLGNGWIIEDCSAANKVCSIASGKALCVVGTASCQEPFSVANAHKCNTLTPDTSLPYSYVNDCVGATACTYTCNDDAYWNNSTGQCEVNSCGGTPPPGASGYDAEENLVVPPSTNWHFSSSDTSTKCEFKCNIGTYDSATGTCNQCTFTGSQTIKLQPLPTTYTGAPDVPKGYTGLQDTYIVSNSTTPNNASTTVRTSTYSWQSIHGLFGFDLAGKLPLSEPIQIDDAQFDIYVASWGGLDSATNVTFGLLTKEFSGATTTWSLAQTGVSWTTPGGDISTSVVKYINASQAFFNINITGLARDWLAMTGRTSTQLGIRTSIPAVNPSFYFASSEYTTDYIRRPKLTITYSCKPIVATVPSQSYLAANTENTTVDAQTQVLGVSTQEGDLIVTRMTFQPYGCSTSLDAEPNRKGTDGVFTVGDNTTWAWAHDASGSTVGDTGIEFANKVNVDINTTKDIMLRIRPIYNSATVVAVSADGNEMPIQQHQFTSGAQVDITGESRSLQVVRTIPQLPSIFDYVLFSGENPIVK